jgi:hypothetical protein
MGEQTMTREEIQSKLDALDRKMEAMKAENPNGEDFWPAFAGEADEITDGASADDYDWALKQIDGILVKHKRAPSDDVAPSDDLPPAP